MGRQVAEGEALSYRDNLVAPLELKCSQYPPHLLCATSNKFRRQTPLHTDMQWQSGLGNSRQWRSSAINQDSKQAAE